MTRVRRGTYLWLLMLGAAIGIIVLAGALGTAPMSGPVAIGLMAIYLFLVFATLAQLNLSSMRVAMPRFSAAARMTSAARRAAQRARAQSNIVAEQTLTDIGLIVNERQRNGQWARHLAQVVSLDDDAVQPFGTFYALPEQGNRLALIQFDIYDHAGQRRFRRQVEQWVRDGENLVVCDRQLPLEDVAGIDRSGVWELRISVDGALAALHSFSVTPSTAERRRQFSGEGEAPMAHLAVPEEEGPLSLEDLLREQRQRG